MGRWEDLCRIIALLEMDLKYEGEAYLLVGIATVKLRSIV